MIAPILRIFWLQLRRDRLAWLLTFVVPVVFFSLFATIFGGQKRTGTPVVRVAVVDEDGSEFSKRFVSALEKEKSLHVRTKGKSDDLLDRNAAEGLVRAGDVSVAIVLRKGLGASFPDFTGTAPAVAVLADTSDPVGPPMIGGLLQGVVMTAAPESLMKGGLAELEKWGGPLTEGLRKAVDMAETRMKQGDSAGVNGSMRGLLRVETVDVLGETKANPAVAFFAAATAVLFLLFTCANAAGGSFVEELESDTIDRLLASNLTMGQLLAGKWLAVGLLGVMQVTVMFLWGALVFQVELFSHLPGFALMTIATAAAASAFGLMLGTACRTRAQLAGVSTTVIILMSALGGSMFPRFLMSEGMQTAGLFTFNAWALDGYTKVFWRDAPLWQLWPQLAMLAGLTVAFLFISRQLARRWEMV